MTFTLPFWLSLAIKMAVTATFVVVASFTAQRAGPLIGAMVATLPISAGPVYVFYALEHSAGFIAESALTSMLINAVTAVFSLTYAHLAQTRGMLMSMCAALAAWFALGAALRLADWTIVRAIVFCVLVYAPCMLLARPYRQAPMPPAIRRWYDLPLRAGMVSLLVCVAVTLGPYLGPFGSGMLAVFPIVLTSLVLILHPRVGARATAAVIANTVSGLPGFAIALGVVHLTAVPLGAALALPLGLAICIGWNLMVLAARRRGIPL